MRKTQLLVRPHCTLLTFPREENCVCKGEFEEKWAFELKGNIHNSCAGVSACVISETTSSKFTKFGIDHGLCVCTFVLKIHP